ncbi:MAG: hypothetical protein IJV00_06500, partial [Clostridia bacterium]|nr:hypothetical protein [Clostridia bacterium]
IKFASFSSAKPNLACDSKFSYAEHNLARRQANLASARYSIFKITSLSRRAERRDPVFIS